MGEAADTEPGPEQMGMERGARLICQMTDGSHAAAGCAGQEGRQARPGLAASSLSHFSLFHLNLSQKAPVPPFPGCAWLSEVVVLVGGRGAMGPISRTWQATCSQHGRLSPER